MTPNLAPVILSFYQTSWPDMYEKAKEEILSAIGPFVCEIKHIGSTAIPGAVAKPEIDIMILVKSFGDAPLFIDAFKSSDTHTSPASKKRFLNAATSEKAKTSSRLFMCTS